MASKSISKHEVIAVRSLVCRTAKEEYLGSFIMKKHVLADGSRSSTRWPATCRGPEKDVSTASSASSSLQQNHKATRTKEIVRTAASRFQRHFKTVSAAAAACCKLQQLETADRGSCLRNWTIPLSSSCEAPMRRLTSPQFLKWRSS